MGIFGISSSGTRNKFLDQFDDTIDPATDGSLWKTLRGVWTVVANKASSSSAANTYPILSIDMPENQGPTTISMKSMGQGTGAALWITDSGTWWAVVAGTDASFGCSCTTQCNLKCNANACNAYICNAFNCPAPNNCNSVGSSTTCAPGSAYNCTSPTCKSGNVANYNACNAYNFGNCNQFRYNLIFPCATFNKTGNCNRYRFGGGTQYCSGNFVGNRFCRSGQNANNYTCNAFNCPAPNNCNTTVTNFFCNPGSAYNCTNPSCATGSCNPSNVYCATFGCDTYFQDCAATCYPTYVRLIKSVANVVTEVSKIVVGNTTASLVNSLKLTINGSQITVKPYSDSNLASQIGSDLVFTPTGATISTQYGIIVTPSVTNQGNSLDDFTIET